MISMSYVIYVISQLPHSAISKGIIFLQFLFEKEDF